jgi:hypothetical protein
MKPHDHLTIIRNLHRARELRVFRDLVEDYFERSRRDEDDLPMDWDGAQRARAHINRMLPRIIRVVRAAGIDGSTTSPIRTDPGPTLGRVEVLQHIFTARYTDGIEQEVFDVLDMALGVYDADRMVALLRTVSPFHYLATALRFLARVPRSALGALGWRREALPQISASDLAQLKALTARLSEVEELIDARCATLQDRQALRLAENARQLAELAERLDFAERVLAQPRQVERLPAPERSDLVTPVG